MLHQKFDGRVAYVTIFKGNDNCHKDELDTANISTDIQMKEREQFH